jgi:hypothetical protein
MLGAIRSSGGGGAVATVFGRSGAVVAGANDYSASQIAGLGGSAGSFVITPGALQTLTAASTIVANAGTIPVAAASPITLTSNPQVSTGANGQRITIVNTGTNAITLVNGSGLILSQNIIVYGGRAIELVYMSAYSSWLAEGFVPESLALTGIPTAPTSAYNTNSTQVATTAQGFNHLYNHDAPGWRGLTLTANWVNYGGGFAAASVKRIGRDMVFLQGVIAVSGSYATAMTTLPLDCRPSASINCISNTSAGLGVLTIDPSGAVTSFTTLAVGQFHVLSASYSL